MFSRNRRKLWLLAVVIAFCNIAMPARLQGEQQLSATARGLESAFYNLVFRVIERDGGKLVSSHSYKTSVATDRAVGTGASISAQDAFPLGANPSNTRKLGFTVFIKAPKTIGNNLCLSLQGRMSSLPVNAAPNTPSVLVRSDDWDAQVAIPMNTPTIVYSSDDPASKRVLEVELTVSVMNSGR